MGLLDRDYKILVDIKTGKIIYSDIVFASRDENISNINIQFNINGEPVNIEGFTFIANIQKPDTLKTPVEVIITDPENGLCILDLPLSLTIETGLYNVEIELANGNELSHTYPFSYTVRDTLYVDSDDSFIDDEDYNILIRAIQKLDNIESEIEKSEISRNDAEADREKKETARQTAESVRANNEVDRKNRFNETVSDINMRIENIEARFERLVTSRQQDFEVIDAREDLDGNTHDSLKDRLNKIETQANFSLVFFETIEG